MGGKNEYQRGEIKPASLCPPDLLRHDEVIVRSSCLGEPYQAFCNFVWNRSSLAHPQILWPCSQLLASPPPPTPPHPSFHSLLQVMKAGCKRVGSDERWAVREQCLASLIRSPFCSIVPSPPFPDSSLTIQVVKGVRGKKAS